MVCQMREPNAGSCSHGLVGVSASPQNTAASRMTLLLLARTRLPATGVVVPRAVATPLHHRVAAGARPRFVESVHLERAARLAPFRVRADRVGHGPRTNRLLATIRSFWRCRLGSLKVVVKALKRPTKWPYSPTARKIWPSTP